VNIALLDQQHQKRFDTVDELDRALRTGEGNSVIDPILGKLVHYARVHFAEEESLTETHNFPGLSTHRTEHESNRARILAPQNRRFSARGQSCQAWGPGLAFVFGAAMVEKTLRKTDQQNCAFLKARGVR
jgi:hemerythrin-like metal-binding protein